jgi:hypothetical protein
MAGEDFIFTYTTGSTILEPAAVIDSANGYFGVATWTASTAFVRQFTVTYNGADAVPDLGCYIKPASSTDIGGYNTRVAAPYNAYQTMLTAGSVANLAIIDGDTFEDAAAGVIVQFNEEEPQILYWGHGDSPNNKVALGSIVAGQEFTLTVGWIYRTIPDVIDPDMMLVDLVLE